MNRWYRFVQLALFLVLLTGCAPVLVQEENAITLDETSKVTDEVPTATEPAAAVTDEGNKIYLVDGTQTALPDLLAADELAKLAALRSAPLAPKYRINGVVSPDGQSVLANIGSDYFFVNLHAQDSNDAIVPVKTEKPVTAFTNYIWLDDYTLGYITSAKSEEAEPGYVGASMDRRTGAVTANEARLAAAASRLTGRL